FQAAFEALTPGRQRGYLLHFSGAKKSETRIRRFGAAAQTARVASRNHFQAAPCSHALRPVLCRPRCSARRARPGATHAPPLWHRPRPRDLNGSARAAHAHR
ncbi:MAG: YdeI/OmpD-associated family protein, partial [Bacteroidota bacterium]